VLESLLRRPNFYWAEEHFQPPLKSHSLADLGMAAATLQGQFSLAFPGPDGAVILLRDRLGINKLFFAIHESGAVLAATFLIDLVNRGVPFEAIYSVPAGHFLAVDPSRPTLALRRYSHIDADSGRHSLPLGPVARHIRESLEVWFSRLAAQFAHRKICLCLSGGLDSSVIAALAKKYFADVTAYTYGYVESGQATSEDVHYARKVADFLGIPFRLIPASSDDVLAVLEDALCYGQDWRDFNVHCAIVNEILARAIASDAERFGSDGPPLVLTGDLMNEFLADYAPLSYENREFYRLPQVSPALLRTALIRGLDAGDRELGIFNHHGIDLIQPYGLLVDEYRRLPATLLGGERSKPDIVREVASDLLPSFLFTRLKARAQVGDPVGPGGILSALLRTGRDAPWLRRAFCHRFMITEERLLDSFIRLGRYRSTSGGPDGRATRNGYYTGSNRANS
jgi:asparagine synthetase B (glutamine-hydrolysing)